MTLQQFGSRLFPGRPAATGELLLAVGAEEAGEAPREVISRIEQLSGALPGDFNPIEGTVAEAHNWYVGRVQSRISGRSRRSEPAAIASPEGFPSDRWSSRGVRLTVLGPQHHEELYLAATNPEAGFRWRYRGRTPSPEQFVGELYGGVLAQYAVEKQTTGRCLGLVTGYSEDFAGRSAYFALLGAGPSTPKSVDFMVGSALFIDYMFRTWGFRKLYADIPGFNWPQFSSLTNGIFELEATLKEKDWYDGELWDSRVVSISSERWTELREWL